MNTAWLILELNISDWVLVLLSTAIIFAILGGKLRGDIAAWRQGRASARQVDGSSSEG